MKYQSEQNNHIMQQAHATVVHQQGQTKVAACEVDLRAFIERHETQDVAVWLIALNNVTSKIFDKVSGIQAAEIIQ